MKFVRLSTRDGQRAQERTVRQPKAKVRKTMVLIPGELLELNEMPQKERCHTDGLRDVVGVQVEVGGVLLRPAASADKGDISQDHSWQQRVQDGPERPPVQLLK